jgi:CRISPR-associated endonuclease/helicase Cas3
VAIGGHHGRFTSYGVVDGYSRQSVGTGGSWPGARTALVRALGNATALPTELPAATIENETLAWLAGLVSVADWIASNNSYFHFACKDVNTVQLFDPAYEGRARETALRALESLGWMRGRAPTVGAPFTELFPFPPNNLQKAAVDVAATLTGPALVIVEAAMGDGKTEAALYLANHWAASGFDGFYIGLPTQATSDQMFDRVSEFLGRSRPGVDSQLQLLHGHASLSAAFQEVRRHSQPDYEPADIMDDEVGEPVGTVLAAEWFTYRKRGLLAPFGVGTVDQAMLSVLQAKHFFVRLFGLTGKVVIIDEIHAYDTYMSVIIERLLAWLAALEVPVVMLSATLPPSRRARLLAAYAGEEAGIEDGDHSYPRITVAESGQRARIAAVGAGDGARSKTIDTRWISDTAPGEPDDSELSALLEAMLRDGGCAAVICNTVARACAVYEALRDGLVSSHGHDWCALDLFHARYPYEWRMQRQNRTLIRFGKPDAMVTDGDGVKHVVERPHRAILVATQVVEQSLDLDFDVMVTDLAPADLVLQRAGRLHRHERVRPAGVADPMILFRGVFERDNVAAFDRGSEAVYDRYSLLRSWLCLRRRESIDIPADVPKIVDEAYGELAEQPGALGTALAQAAVNQVAETEKDEHEAETRYIKHPAFSSDFAQIASHSLQEDSPEFNLRLQALTRLSGPSMTLIVLCGSDGAATTMTGERVNVTRKPDTALAQTLLRWSVTESRKPAVLEVIDSPRHAAWQESALLRDCRILFIDEDGRGNVGDVQYRLNEELGLVYERV